MKKILILVVIAILSTACSSPSTDKKSSAYNYLNDIDKGSVEFAGVDGDFAYDMSNPNELRKNATNVFIANIESIDSATCNLEGKGYSPIPYTLGKLNVIQNYVGDTNDQIDFARLGGTVTIEEYDRNAPKSAVEKRNFLRDQQGAKAVQYMNVIFNGDIELSAEKTYLFYANYNDKYDRYEILGLEHGSRELDGFDTKAKSINEQVTILNNATDKKENLEKYIQQSLK